MASARFIRRVGRLGRSFFFQAEDGIRDYKVTGVQTCALPISGRLDAVLHEPPPQRTSHTIGRPRVVGKRLPALEQVLQDAQTLWQKRTLDWYGEGERTLEMCTGTAPWYRYGSDPLPIRWVLTRDP